MATTYTFNLSTDFPNGTINLAKFDAEIRASAITISLVGVSLNGNTVSIVFNAALGPSDITILDGNTTNPAGGLIAQTDYTPSSSVDLVKVQEEHIPTNGAYQVKSLILYAAAATTSVQTYDWPHPVSILDFWWITIPQDKGDFVNICIGPNTPTGELTQNANIGDTLLNVQYTVVANTYPGDFVTLSDGVQLEGPILVIEIDTLANTLTVQTALTLNFLATSPTYILSTSQILSGSEIGADTKVTIGRKKIGGSYLPANIPIQVSWTNQFPIYTIGKLSADLAASSSSMTVDSDARAALVFGNGIELTDGINTDDLGRVTFVNLYNGQVFFTTPNVHAFAAATPTYVQITGKLITGYIEYLR